MATSGTMVGNGLTIGGRGSNYYFINWQLAGQSVDGNYSVINWQAYFHFNGADAQLDSAYVDAAGARRYTNGGRVYNYAGNFSTRDLGIASGQFTVGHDGNGNASFGIGGAISVYQTGNSGGSAGFDLPNIPRYANISDWYPTNQTEKSTDVYVRADRTADIVNYSLNDQPWTRGYTGGFGEVGFTIPGLNPATTYSLRVSIRNAASGLYTDSGYKSFTTLPVTVTALTIAGSTDTSLTINVTTSHIADQLQYSLDGGAWNAINTGDFTNTSYTITGLNANQTYTVAVRAKHKDSQTYTPSVSKPATTQFPQPLKAINLAPAAGKGVGILTPTLTWQYTSTSPDAQSAYQILVRLESTGATVWDSGKVVSGTSSATMPGSLLQFNKNYQWQVKTWSSTDIAGPYSDLVLFKTSQPPVVTITAPTAGQKVSTNAPNIAWTFADPEGTAQTARRITIKRITATGQTDGITVFTTYENNTNDLDYIIPAGSLENGSRYIAIVEATDSDGVVGTSAVREFTVEFIGPEPPNVNAILSEDKLFSRIIVSTNKPKDDAFDTDTINVYKREFGTTPWEKIGSVQASRTYIDQFDSIVGYTYGRAADTASLSSISRQGVGSLSLKTTSAGTAKYSKPTSAGTLIGFDKIRVWLYKSTTAAFTSVTFKIGADANNYYSFTVTAAEMTALVWKSIEKNVNSLTIVGNPSLGNIAYEEINVVATGAINTEDLLVDSFRLVAASDALFLYDYELANNKTYQYAASAYNSRENLESALTTIATPVEVIYADMLNTFIIPKGSEQNGLVVFMDGEDAPNYISRSDTNYLQPVGLSKPVVYTRGSQKYHTGSMTVRFFDDKFGGRGLDGVDMLERIKNYKPLLIRTWWGRNYYVSIDGDLSVVRKPGIGWYVTFSYTEIDEGA